MNWIVGTSNNLCKMSDWALWEGQPPPIWKKRLLVA
jgi:hypothetical protein